MTHIKAILRVLRHLPGRPMRGGATRVGLAMIFATGAPLAAQAALAPNYQRLAEMRAILDSPAIAETFDVRRPLQRIEYLGPDRYRATGGGCQLDLELMEKPLPQGMVGARQFSVRARKVVCN